MNALEICVEGEGKGKGGATGGWGTKEVIGHEPAVSSGNTGQEETTNSPRKEETMPATQTADGGGHKAPTRWGEVPVCPSSLTDGLGPVRAGPGCYLPSSTGVDTTPYTGTGGHSVQDANDGDVLWFSTAS